MKTSVLKADKRQAAAVTEQLLKMTTPKGSAIFQKREIENGWEVFTTKTKDKIEWVVFRFTTSEIGPKVEWDEKAVTIA